ncbi:uncharacterized protein BDZ99DRAFT_461680, partial [Mytilinidion resinicola]
MPSTSTSVERIVLSSPADWKHWFFTVETKAYSGNVWEYVNPNKPFSDDSTKLNKPGRPALPAAASSAETWTPAAKL